MKITVHDEETARQLDNMLTEQGYEAAVQVHCSALAPELGWYNGEQWVVVEYEIPN